jgi:uncharacterized caspase-like protein
MRRARQLSLVIALTLLAVCAGRASALAQDGSDSRTPKLYVLAVGIREYHRYPRHNPVYADKDAKDFAKTIEQAAKGRFAKVEVKPLINAEANRASIEAAIKDIILKARSEDTFIFFFSGHGESQAKPGEEEQFYLIPSDCDIAEGDDLDVKGISAAQLQSWFIQVEAQRQFIILDSNKSDRGFQSFKEQVDWENQRLRHLAPRSMAVLSVRGISFEFNSLRNGLLTYVILQGFKGGAALSTGDVTVRNLVAYVNSQSPIVLRRSATARTRALLRRNPGSGRPFVYLSGDDFTLGSRVFAKDETGRPPLTREEARLGHGPAAVTSLGRSEAGGVEVADTAQVKTRWIPLPECKAYSKTFPSASTSGRRGKDIALVIGTDHYTDNQWPPLSSPVLDASSIAAELNTRYGFETEVLKDPPLKCMDDAINRYGDRVYPYDAQLFIFISGHGHYREDTGMGFLIAEDSPRAGVSQRNAFDHGSLRRMLDAINCKHILLVIDSCFSGTIDQLLERTDQAEPGEVNAGSRPGAPAMIEISERRDIVDDYVERKMKRETRQFLTSGGKEYVPDGNDGAHSPFAGKFLEALRMPGGADKYITLTQILSLMERVDPEPYWGRWGHNDVRSQFFFFMQN